MNISLALGPSTVFIFFVLCRFLIFFFVAWSNIERGRPPFAVLRPLTRLKNPIGPERESGQVCTIAG